MKSMTGFGMDVISSPDLNLELSIRAVNGRYLDIRLHMPKQYMVFEAELKKIVSEKVARGTVDVYINRRASEGSIGAINLNLKMAKKWQKAYGDLAKELKLTSEVNLETLAERPEVISLSESLTVENKEKQAVTETLKGALDKLIEEKKREGKALQKDLSDSLQELERLLTAVRDLAPATNKELRSKFEQRLEKLKGSEGIDPYRVAQEVALFLDRCDVNEEISRLHEHINLFQNLVKDDQANGKKLDFYCQELLREFNTIGSKSSQAKLTQLVVNAKSVIEQIREQVQNVE